MSNPTPQEKRDGVEVVDNYLRKVTTFCVISKDEMKREMCELIDKRFAYIESDLRDANLALHTVAENARREVKGVQREASYIHYNLRNAIRSERNGTNINGHEKDVDRWLEELQKLSPSPQGRGGNETKI